MIRIATIALTCVAVCIPSAKACDGEDDGQFVPITVTLRNVDGEPISFVVPAGSDSARGAWRRMSFASRWFHVPCEQFGVRFVDQPQEPIKRLMSFEKLLFESQFSDGDKGSNEEPRSPLNHVGPTQELAPAFVRGSKAEAYNDAIDTWLSFNGYRRSDDEQPEVKWTIEDFKTVRRWVRDALWPWKDRSTPFRTHGGII